MAVTLSRRHLLRGTVAAAVGFLPSAIASAAAQTPVQLNAMTRTLDVKGKSATVLGVMQNNGLPGLFLDPGQRFTVNLANQLSEDTIVHWHGQTPPVADDGVAITGEEKVIGPDTVRAYDYAPRPGTYWMHSHQGMQEMQLLAAPLIVRTADDLRQDAQEVTVILHDFTFKTPQEVIKQVSGGAMSQMPMSGMPMSGAPSGGAIPGMAGGGKPQAKPPMQMGGDGQPDVNDFDYDAYLANDRTLDDPMMVRTERNGRVRLRLINGASSTVFWLELVGADGTLIAVDGERVRPLRGRRFPMAQAQRLDIMVDVPAGKVVPVLAQREGDRVRTGIILAAPGAMVAKIPELAKLPSEPMGISLEAQLSALNPLAARPVNRRIPVVLSGSMAPYKWFINGRSWSNREPLRVAKGQRVEFDIVNQTPMGHPMHLHGHAFQIVELNGKGLAGALRDTVQVPAKGSVKIAFDADNPGCWLFHCHNLLHMETGMITEVIYDT
jgi:FtsP/CotA-like multicopper oxidase with cupredoxin domain